MLEQTNNKSAFEQHSTQAKLYPDQGERKNKHKHNILGKFMSQGVQTNTDKNPCTKKINNKVNSMQTIWKKMTIILMKIKNQNIRSNNRRKPVHCIMLDNNAFGKRK